MVWYLIIGTLAAFGLFCALWVLTVGMRSFGNKSVLVCYCKDGTEPILRYSRLRSAGLLKCPLVLVGCNLTEKEARILQSKYPGIEFCSPEALPDRLEWERNRLE